MLLGTREGALLDPGHLLVGGGVFEKKNVPYKYQCDFLINKND